MTTSDTTGITTHTPTAPIVKVTPELIRAHLNSLAGSLSYFNDSCQQHAQATLHLAEATSRVGEVAQRIQGLRIDALDGLVDHLRDLIDSVAPLHVAAIDGGRVTAGHTVDDRIRDRLVQAVIDLGFEATRP